MVFDEIVVGSGLSALGTVLGFPAHRRVLVIGGPVRGQFVYYDGDRTNPCAYLGHGGLGTSWRGVIPTGGQQTFAGASTEPFETFFRHFYPNTDIFKRLGKPGLFVPWRPVRPNAEWRRLKAERSDRLVFRHECVSRFTAEDRDVLVYAAGSTYRAKRVWLCAGPLHSPALLDRSMERRVSRQFVSDHVLCYLGQIDRLRTSVAPPRVQRTKDGVWFEGRYDDQTRAFYTLRPARFAYSRLDHAVVQRMRPPRVGIDLQKILRSTSLGWIAQVLYNRFGMFPNARMQSVYAQISVPDAHRFCSGDARLSTRSDVIQPFVDEVRASSPWKGMQWSSRPDIFLPSIHLHHSVDVDALTNADVNRPTSRVQVVDASVLRDIGADHHSFKLMVAAFQRARLLTQSEEGTRTATPASCSMV
jgi:hypothetical protein